MFGIEPSGMVEPSGYRAQSGNAPAQAPVHTNPATTRVRSSSFKYYIHDSTDALRLKLIGELTQAEIPELNGCWRTARTTLQRRKLILDLRTLMTVDEAGKQWLAAMSAEGAYYLPQDYLLTCVAGQHAPELETSAAARKLGIFSRLASLLRGGRVPPARSSTQEP